MSCGKETIFVKVGDIFSRGEDGWIKIPPGTDDSARCAAPRLRSADGKEITVVQVAASVNMHMYVESLEPGRGRLEAEKELRYWGATDEDIKNLLG